MQVDTPRGQPHECTSTALMLQVFAGGPVSGSPKIEYQNSKIVALSVVILIPKWDSCPGIPDKILYASIYATALLSRPVQIRGKGVCYRGTIDTIDC